MQQRRLLTDGQWVEYGSRQWNAFELDIVHLLVIRHTARSCVMYSPGRLPEREPLTCKYSLLHPRIAYCAVLDLLV